MRSAEVKVLVTQIIVFVYISISLYVVAKHGLPALVSAAVLGVVLWFFYTWLVKYF